MIKITPNEVNLISKYIYETTGIVLDHSKAYLIETRLNSLLEEFTCASFAELYNKVKTDAAKTIERKIIDAICTNETMFFRDKGPFDLLQHKILPDLIDLRTANSSGVLPTSIRIWSAACSTGQEVYSIAIVLKELLPDISKYDIKLLGTDISDAAIAQSSYGVYSRFEIERGLPENKLLKYFHRNGEGWKVNDEIRAMATFKRMNLTLPLTAIGTFDIVLCRNVAIYFDMEARTKLFEKIANVMEPDGYLIIGATESLTGICPQFEPKRYLKSIFYQLKTQRTDIVNRYNG